MYLDMFHAEGGVGTPHPRITHPDFPHFPHTFYYARPGGRAHKSDQIISRTIRPNGLGRHFTMYLDIFHAKVGVGTPHPGITHPNFLHFTMCALGGAHTKVTKIF